MTIEKLNICVADTETIGLPPENFVYDFGYVIQDRKGNILFEQAHLVEEIVTDSKKMMGAFYAGKIFSHYLPLVDAGLIDIRPFKYIKEEYNDIAAQYNINVFSAYNLGFDVRALSATNALLSTGKFLNTKPQLLDIWQFACQVLLNRPTYKRLAQQHNWVSDAGNMRTNAECAYRYSSGNVNAEEAHTALCDARIESEILTKCYRQKKSVPYGIKDAQPWRIVNA
jgi:hypothetical protein